MTMVSLSIAMHVRCGKCQSSIHLGAVVDRARCPSCGHVEPMPAERWRKAMDTVVFDGPDLPADKQIARDDDEIWIIAERKSPCCATCEAALPPNVATQARAHGKSFCVGCGAKIAVRAVPPVLQSAFPCITHFFGEDGVQLKTPDAAIPNAGDVISVRCPDCGGNIQPDGRSRAIRCPYCSVTVVLPQAIWRRLHSGSNEPHVFYLLHDPSLPRPLGRADVMWSSLDGICCDPLGNLYGVGEDDGRFSSESHMVFALDNRLQTKWVRKSLPIEDDARILWRNDGTLIVWSPERYSAMLFRAADGVELGKIGGEQPPHHDRHILDLSRAVSLAVDFDGTFLMSKRDRLARCSADGNGTYVWPPGQGFLDGMFMEKLKPWTDNDEEDALSIYELGDRPIKARDLYVRVGWDGRTYLHRDQYLRCYDRSGKKLYEAELPDKGGTYDFGIDARGIVYVMRWLESDTHGIYRIFPGGSSSLFIDGKHPHTPIRDDRRMAVHLDGTIVIADYGRQLRIFAPDGRMLYRSEPSGKDDAEYMQKQAKKQSHDRVR